MNGKMLFAGEHTSTQFMGYMNGAYETGVKAAEQILQTRGFALHA
jgi:monoamine oxidase